MKLGIMQPYFMPYLGYWQLINAVDKFVVLDNVNFIKQGYINRNSILLGGVAHQVNIQVQAISSNKSINEHQLNENPVWRKKILRTIKQSYAKAPFFEVVFPVIENILSFQEINLSKFLVNQLCKVSEYLHIETEIIESASVYDTKGLMSQDRILEICKQAGASHYINSIGGQTLYSRDDFSEKGIDLSFIKTGEYWYKQYNDTFIPDLSVIDVMMFNSKEQVYKMLNQYRLF